VLAMSAGTSVAEAVTGYESSSATRTLEHIGYVGIARVWVPSSDAEYWGFCVLLRADAPERCQDQPPLS
jgi:hypothetical protein